MKIYLIILASMCNHLAFIGSRVVITLHAIEYGSAPATIGVLIALYALGPLVLGAATGRFADRVGARSPMIACTLGLTVALLLPVFVPGLPVFFCMAMLIGMAMNSYFIAVQGVIGAFGREQDRLRNYGLLSVGFSVSAFFGPLITGFSIDYLGYTSAYLVLCAFTVIPLLILCLMPHLIPRLPRNGEKAGGESGEHLLRIPALRNLFLVSGIVSCAWDLYGFYMPIYARQIGLSASEIGMILAAFAIAMFVIRLFLSAMTQRTSEMRMLVTAIFIASATFFMFPFFHNPWVLAAISFLLGLGVGMGQPLTMTIIYSMAPKGRTSEAAGVRAMINSGIHVVIPLLFGGLGSALGHNAVFLSNAVLLLFSGVVGSRSARLHAK